MKEQPPASHDHTSDLLTTEFIEDELRHGGVVYVTLCDETQRSTEDESCRERLSEEVNSLLLLCGVEPDEWPPHVKGVIRTRNEAVELTRRDAQRVAEYTQPGEWLHELTWRDMQIAEGAPQSDTVTIVMKLPQRRHLLLIGKGECWQDHGSHQIEWRMQFRAAIMEQWAYNVE